MEHPRHALDGQFEDHHREVGGEGRVASLVIYETDLTVTRGQAEKCLDHVVAVETAHPRGACNAPAGVDLELSAQLGGSVDRLRSRLVPFEVGTRLGAVEDVVGAQVHHVGSDATSTVGQEPCCAAVGCVCQLGLGLARIHGGEGSRVDHHVGSPLCDQRQRRVPVREIHLRQIHPQHLVLVRCVEKRHQFAAQLAPAPCDQNPHRRLTIGTSPVADPRLEGFPPVPVVPVERNRLGEGVLEIDLG